MRRFVIQNAQGARIGEGIERADGGIVARLSLDWPGAHLGERSQWEDLEVALLVISGLGLKLEWLPQETPGVRSKA